MTDQTTQTGSSQAASGQSSSSSTGQSQQAGDQGAQSGASGTQAQGSAPERPAYVPEKFWDTEKREVRADDFTRDYNDLAAFRAEQEIKKNALPKSADEYQIALPPDFKAPEGVKFEFNKDDPLLAHARQVAFQTGADQETFSKYMGIYAANEIAKQTQLNTARNAEMQKLGAAGPQRIDNIEAFFKGRVGSDADVIVNQLRQFPHAGMVQAFEKVIAQFSSQGGAQFDQRGRVNEQNEGKIPGFEDMNFKQQRVAQMDRQQKAASGR